MISSRTERERLECTKLCRVCRRKVANERRKTCSTACATILQLRNKPSRVFNKFLPEDAEENLHGFWVPSPEEIEIAKLEIRKRNEEIVKSMRWAPR